MPNFVIADPKAQGGWTHIWLMRTNNGGFVEVERPCRFVLDRDRLVLIQVDIEIGGAMVPATQEETHDLLDSLVNANPGVIDDPESCGLEASDRLPAWCVSPASEASNERI